MSAIPDQQIILVKLELMKYQEGKIKWHEMVLNIISHLMLGYK